MLPLALFTVAYMLGFGVLAVVTGKTEFIFYGVIMLVLIGFVMALHRRVRFSTLTLWLLAFWGFLHMAGGTVPIPREFMASLVPEPGTGNVLYNFRPFAWVPKYDQFTHAFGFFTATLAAWEALKYAATPARLSYTPGLAVIMTLVGMGLGAMNEVVEFIAVLTIPNTNVGGYVNTGWDLVSNLTGCIIASLVIFARERPR